MTKVQLGPRNYAKYLGAITVCSLKLESSSVWFTLEFEFAL